jgi:TPR repeat protein
MAASIGPDSESARLYQEARSLYVSGRRDEAIKILEGLANEGLGPAQAALGNMLLFCPVPDPVRAKFWLEKAAANLVAEAYYGLGMISLHGLESEKSPHQAASHFFEGAKIGDAQCCEMLGEMFASGKLGECRHDLAIPVYQQAASGGSALAQRRLGVYFSDGKEVEQDLSLARDFYEAAAMQGDPYAANNLALMYERGRGIEVDIDKAIFFYRIAADSGIPTAFQNLAACLAHPDAAHPDLEEAANWFHKGADAGLSLSMLSLARIYSHGEGVIKNLQLAEYWRQRAAQTLDPEIDGNPIIPGKN